MPTLNQTKEFVAHLFDGVYDKGGDAYVNHCFRVEAGLPETATEDERHAALLHDVLEDTDETTNTLHGRGYSFRTVLLVEALTNKAGENYQDHMKAVADTKDHGLINIKLSDNRDNSDPARHTCFTKKDSGRRMEKYARAREVLLNGLV